MILSDFDSLNKNGTFDVVVFFRSLFGFLLKIIFTPIIQYYIDGQGKTNMVRLVFHKWKYKSMFII